MFSALVGASIRKFLVIDDNVDNRFLLSRTLRRKYPDAVIEECSTLEDAHRVIAAGKLDAIISHRAGEIDGIELVRELRLADPAVPIVMVSGFDRTRAALAAGATRFLNYDEWLRLPSVIDEIFATQPWSWQVGALAHAIRLHAIVTFDYGELDGPATAHEVEPHLLGKTAEGKFLLRAHAATSRSDRRGLGWETFAVDRIHHLVITDRNFAPHNGEATSDRQIAEVLCRA